MAVGFSTEGFPHVMNGERCRLATLVIPMLMSIKCPACGMLNTLPATRGGDKVFCEKCRGLLPDSQDVEVLDVVPAPDSGSELAEVIPVVATTKSARARPTKGVAYSRIKAAYNASGATILAALFVIAGWYIHPRWLGWSVFGIGCAFFLGALLEIRKVFDRSSVLVFTDEGLVDKREEEGQQLIPWSQIRKVTVHRLRVNMVTATTTLILDMDENGNQFQRKLDVDTLAESPKAIADRIWSYVNG